MEHSSRKDNSSSTTQGISRTFWKPKFRSPQ